MFYVLVVEIKVIWHLMHVCASLMLTAGVVLYHLNFVCNLIRLLDLCGLIGLLVMPVFGARHALVTELISYLKYLERTIFKCSN